MHYMFVYALIYVYALCLFDICMHVQSLFDQSVIFARLILWPILIQPIRGQTYSVVPYEIYVNNGNGILTTALSSAKCIVQETLF